MCLHRQAGLHLPRLAALLQCRSRLPVRLLHPGRPCHSLLEVSLLYTFLNEMDPRRRGDKHQLYKRQQMRYNIDKDNGKDRT